MYYIGNNTFQILLIGCFFKGVFNVDVHRAVVFPGFGYGFNKLADIKGLHKETACAKVYNFFLYRRHFLICGYDNNRELAYLF